MRSPAARCLAVASPLLLALAACDATGNPRSIGAPTEPSLGKSGKPSAGSSTFAPMEISPTSMTVSVGSSTTVSVTYRDAKGNVIPDTNFRWTYYGCVPVAPAGATCNDLISLLPLSPTLRQAEILALQAGQVRIYATDGYGTYVWADLAMQ